MNNKEYPFWKLLRAQWSLKNDGPTLIINLTLAIFGSTVLVSLGNLTYSNTGLPVKGFDLFYGFIILTITFFVLFTIFWQGLKLISFSLFCGLLCYALRSKFSEEDSYDKHKDMYEEMLTWRQ